MAFFIYTSLQPFLNNDPVSYVTLAGHHLCWFVSDLVIWWHWWATLIGLQLLYYVGCLIYPMYSFIVRFADVNFVSSRGNPKCFSSTILPIDGRLLVLSGVFNVHSHFLFYLRRTIPVYNGSYANLVIFYWNQYRDNLGAYPPHGWPLHCWLTLCIYFIFIKLISYGYCRILCMMVYNLWSKINSTFKYFWKKVPALIFGPLELASSVSNVTAQHSDPSKIIK